MVGNVRQRISVALPPEDERPRGGEIEAAADGGEKRQMSAKNGLPGYGRVSCTLGHTKCFRMAV